MSDQFTDMLGVLAHEMRTPISAILGYQELLADGIIGTVDERGQEPLARIAYSAKQLLHLIDGVQEVSSPHEKRLESHAESFDPEPVLRRCVDEVLVDAAGRNVQLDTDIPSLPRLVGDPNRFCRAIDLALAAAVKTSHGATLHVTAHATDGEVQVAITNTGLEPAKDNPDNLEPQEKASKLTGAGLRLAIVRHIAQQMAGDIALQRRDGSTTLLLQFPISS